MLFLYPCELGDGCKQSDICRTTFIPKQTVNSAIRSLQKKEYLTLASGKGRSMHIYLTEQGLQLVRRTIFPMVEIENEAFPKLTEKEYKTILHFHAQYAACSQYVLSCQSSQDSCVVEI